MKKIISKAAAEAVKRAPLASHVDELDGLRLHRDLLRLNEARVAANAALQAAHDLEDAYKETLLDAAAKYGFDPAKGDGVSFADWSITRAE